ncbi:MAG: hypothetical protein ACI93R_000204 [Flavobacteriales bacterium]|jgi:hypothetical protein
MIKTIKKFAFPLVASSAFALMSTAAVANTTRLVATVNHPGAPGTMCVTKVYVTFASNGMYVSQRSDTTCS